MIAFRLQNFRGFSDTEWIELKPLTLLVGPNNTGKSSVLRFLPLLRQSVESPTRGPFLWNKEGGLDFGGLDEVRKRGVGGSLKVRLRAVLPGFRPDFWPTLSSEGGMTTIRRSGSVEWHVEIDSAVEGSLRLGLKIDDRLVPADVSSRGSVVELDRKAIPEASRPVVEFNRGPCPTVGWPAVKGGSAGSLLAGPRRSPMVISQQSLLVSFFDGVEAFDRRLRAWASEIAYLGPSREGPLRYYRNWNDPGRRLDPAGRNLPSILGALPPQRRKEFNSLLEERLGYRVHLETIGPTSEVSLIDREGEKYNLMDLGFGFSQVLPVYLQAFIGLQPEPEAGRVVSAFAVEQPELHLHPRHQAQLADLFAAIVAAPRSPEHPGFPLMVETHSEALIDRMAELVEEKKVQADDIQVLIFEKRGKDCFVRKTRYDDGGNLVEWPPGFLAR